MLPLHTQVNSIEFLFDPLNLIVESCIRDDRIVPFVSKKGEHIDDKIHPVIRLLFSDHICANMLEKRSALVILQSVPVKERGTDVLDKIRIVAYKDTVSFMYEPALEDVRACILPVLGMAGNQDHLHAITPSRRYCAFLPQQLNSSHWPPR